MAAVSVTATQVATMFPPDMNEIYSGVAGAAISAGQIVYLHADGDWQLASAAAAGTAVNLGVALNSTGSGQIISVLTRGAVSGYTLTALAYGASIYLGDTAGTADTAAGTVSTVIGRVMSVPNPLNAVRKIAVFGGA